MKKLFSFIFILLVSHPFFAEDENEIFRQLALSGNVLAQPFEVNSRIITITDGGFISTFSTDGYRKYERPLKNRPSSDYTVTKNGIILSVSLDRRTVSFYNPDGYFVWSQTFDEPVKNSPVAGYDGRIFVSTENALYCFGVTGGLRWKRTVPATIDEPVRTLNDGTLLCINCSQGNESRAFRFTPYGELIEEITFSGEAVLTAEHENGVLILFSDGTFGCCSVQENLAVSLWATLPVPNMHISRDRTDVAFVLRLGTSSAAVLYPNGVISVINTNNGTEKCRTSVSSGFKKGTLFYGCGNLMAITEYDSEVVFSLISLNGELVWSGMRRTNGEMKYFFTSDGNLLQFTDNWLLSVSRPLKSNKNNNYAMSNSNFIKRPGFYGTYTGTSEEKHINDILTGFKNIIAEMQPFLAESYDYDIDPSIFENDIILSLSCIQEAGLTGYDFSFQIAEIINNSDNELYVRTALEYCLMNGYDPDEYMLEAIYSFINTTHKYMCSDSLYKKMCDATSSICRFSGGDIFQNYGSRILVQFMSSGYSTSIKDYAVATMKTLMELQI